MSLKATLLPLTLLVLPGFGSAQVTNPTAQQPCQDSPNGTTAETIVLPLEPLASRGLLLVRVTVNGRAGQLVLDTGAGQTTLSRQIADVSREVFERETKALRQQSSTHTWVTLPAKVTLGIGPLAERRVVQIADFDEVSRLAGTQIDGVLGTDVLAEFAHVTIDFHARTLTLRKSVQASAEEGKVPAVELILSNFAGAPQDVFDSATRQARTIFALAGVNLDSVTCLAHERANDTRCAQQPGANQVHIRLLRRPRDRKIEFDPHTGGVAIRGTEARNSGFVTIYYDRVQAIAERMLISRATVLGHALAHEVGHLLLPTGSHSRDGIMRERLRPDDWRNASMGRLLFTSQQKGLMQLALRPSAEGDARRLARQDRP